MNNYEFYSNLQKYQENDIEHGIGSKIANGLNSAYNWAKEKVSGKSDFQPTYYQKIDNAYGPGKARYFYSKEEWDAYQRELAGYRQKADQDVATRNAEMQRREQIQKQNYTNNRRAAEQAGAQRAFNESSRGKLYNNSQSSREAAMKTGQQTISQQQKAAQAHALNRGKGVTQNINNHAEEERARKMKENAQNEVDAQRHAQAENYRKNMQSSQSKFNAKAQRAQKMKENAANEVQAQKERRMQDAERKLSSGRAAAEQKAKDRNVNQYETQQRNISSYKSQGVQIDDIIKYAKESPDIGAKEISEKFNISPSSAAAMVYNTTGIMVPVSREDYWNEHEHDSRTGNIVKKKK